MKKYIVGSPETLLSFLKEMHFIGTAAIGCHLDLHIPENGLHYGRVTEVVNRDSFKNKNSYICIKFNSDSIDKIMVNDEGYLKIVLNYGHFPDFRLLK